MGNRAFVKGKGMAFGVYLHWNGGRDSVEAFLQYCKLKGYRDFNSSDGYGIARFCQVVSNFLGGTNSIGICTTGTGEDNGTYIIDGWEIVGREDFNKEEQYKYDLDEMMQEIDKRQPEKEQLGNYLTAEEVPTCDLEIGDKVYLEDGEGHFKLYDVVGFGEAGSIHNGINTSHVPYVNKYENNGDYSWNCNNYITCDIVKVDEIKNRMGMELI